MAVVERNVAQLTRAMDAWLAAAPGGQGGRIERIVAAEGGASSETWLLDVLIAGRAHPARWVLRIEPRGHQVYEDPSVERQFRMIRALYEHTALPVPPALAYEADEGIIGAPFFLMERVDGDAPPNSYHESGLFADAAPDRRAAMWEDSISLMAQLHRAPVERFAFLAFAPEAAENDGTAQELLRWDSYRRWAGLAPCPLLDRARQWLEDHRPGASPPGVAWGDARPCNILYRDGRAAGMLDWETASLGGAETDLGWWIAHYRMVSDVVGIARLDGLGSPDETIRAWEACAGRKAEAMEWHIAFATWRFALISERAIALAVAAGRYPADAGGDNNPAIRLLRELVS